MKKSTRKTAGTRRGAQRVAKSTGELSDLTPDPKNRRRHNERNIDLIASSLQEVGAARSIVVDEDNVVLAGNGVERAARQAGITRVRFIDTDGTEIIAVRRRGLTPEQKRSLAIADNRTTELSAWNFEQLAEDQKDGLTFEPYWSEHELAAMFESDEQPSKAAPAPAAAREFQTFSCRLSVEQDQIVRTALKRAQKAFKVSSNGDALVKALQAWMNGLKR